MKEKVLFFVTEDWTFWGVRLSLARAVRDLGYEVVVVTRVREHGERIKNEGFTLEPLEINRSGLNPFKDILVVFKLIRLFIKHKPKVVQNISIKPVLYGALAARITGVKKINCLLNGMGILFSDSNSKFKLFIQSMVRLGLKVLLNREGIITVVQNSVDKLLLINDIKVAKKSVVLILGSGVNTEVFTPSDEPEGRVRITYVGRLLWDKGVGILVDAAKILKKRGLDCTITLVGSVDQVNPNSIPQKQIDSWVNDGIIEFWGEQSEINLVWNKSHVSVLLTSYREGLPKTLLESASCGRPIVASDNAGCLEIVENNVNGFIVSNKSSSKLADALQILILDKTLRVNMGIKGREKVLNSFSDDVIIKQTLALYFE